MQINLCYTVCNFNPPTREIVGRLPKGKLPIKAFPHFLMVIIHSAFCNTISYSGTKKEWIKISGDPSDVQLLTKGFGTTKARINKEAKLPLFKVKSTNNCNH